MVVKYVDKITTEGRRFIGGEIMLKVRKQGIYAEKLFLRTSNQKENIFIEKRRYRKIDWNKKNCLG